MPDFETTVNPGGTPELGPRLRWNNSSNVLCNYMKEQKFLDMIIRNRAIIPRYVIEPLDYLGLKDIKKVCFPMTCFCDIPFSKVSTHMSSYGEYGIGLDKESMIEKYGVQPIHYINSTSPLANDFKTAFLAFYRSDETLTDSAQVLLDYIVSTLVFMKPIWRPEKAADGAESTYVYQDECEWRYIPSDNFPRELHLILPQSETSERGRDVYSEALARHEECWLRFSWDDVKYIIVPDEFAAKHTIGTILSLEIAEDEKYMLISKIEISKRFLENM